MLFDKDAPLKNEFLQLFNSLFENADAYIELVKLICEKAARREPIETQRSVENVFWWRSFVESDKRFNRGRFC